MRIGLVGLLVSILLCGIKWATFGCSRGRSHRNPGLRLLFVLHWKLILRSSLHAVFTHPTFCTKEQIQSMLEYCSHVFVRAWTIVWLIDISFLTSSLYSFACGLAVPTLSLLLLLHFYIVVFTVPFPMIFSSSPRLQMISRRFQVHGNRWRT